MSDDLLCHDYKLIVEQFSEYLLGRGYCNRLVAERPRSLVRFFLYLQGRDIYDLQQVKCDDIRDYELYLLRDMGLQLQSICNILKDIKSLYRYLLVCGKVYVNPSATISYPRLPRTLPKNILEVCEVEQLLKQANPESLLGIRDRAILELFYSSGIRNSELRCLKIKDVSLKTRELFVVGKGQREAIVPFSQSAANALNHYLLFSRPQLIKSKRYLSCSYMFLSKNGNLLSKGCINRMFRHYAKMAGIDKKISAHCLRHSCATHLLKNGADIRYIQRLLRHKCLNTTQIYTRVEISDLKEAQSRYHPLEINRRRRLDEE